MPLSITAYDLYRRLPQDLTSPTTQGGVLSLSCMVVMATLAFCEFSDYLYPPVVSDVVMDANTEPQIRINFDITALEMPCDWVELDVKDRLGANRVDVVPNVKKHVVQGDKLQALHQASPPPNHPVSEMSEQELQAAMAQEGESPHLNAAGLAKVLKEKEYVFVDFYAPWCRWCRYLAPVWEEFAKEMHDRHYHVAVRKVDCVQNADVCREQRIMAFPTLRLFKGGQFLADYQKRRGTEELIKWAGDVTNEDAQEHHYKHVEVKGQNEEHQGCRFTGHILVNRVPGNFHLQAKSNVHSMNPKETNLSHVVTHLSYGDPIPPEVLRKLPAAFKAYLTPLNEKVFATETPHITFDHFIKVVSTVYDFGWREPYSGYQMQYSNHQYLFQEQHADDDEGKVPEARFSFDFAPTAVVIRYGGKRWYEFVTNLCAIIGGVFTVMGLIDRSLHGVRTKIFKESIGKLT